MGPGISYASWAEGIRAAAQNLGGPLYLGDGRVTVVAIRDRWAPASAANDPTGLNSNWVRNVSTYLTELGGDPAGSVFPGHAAPAPVAGTAPVAGGSAVAPVVYAPAVPEIGRSGKGPSAAESALAMLGAPAVARGDGSEAGFGPAGLVTWAYAEHGVVAPRTLAAQATTGRGIAPRDLDSGDVILFADASGAIVHAGLYVGGGQFVHASEPGDTVRLSSLYEPYYAESYAGARRY
jgi:cell wall-associated NlpC family hydrolase